MDAAYLAPPHSYSRPLKRGILRAGMKVVTLTPPEAAQRVLDSPGTPGLVPLALALKMRICEGPMVYSIGETMSVIIVSRQSMGIEDCRSIAVSGESRTSMRYLKESAARAGLQPRLVVTSYTGAEELLSIAPCALLLGDEALRARTRYHVVEDLGSMVERILNIHPVYAVTAVHPDARCPRRLRLYRPRPSPVDPRLTSRATGIPLDEAMRYHKVIGLDYRGDLLARAIHVIG